MSVSIIVPAYRSAKFLEKHVKLIERELNAVAKDFEILLVEGGSPDNSAEIAEAIAKKNSKVRHIHREKKLGKGAALSLGFKEAKGEIVGFIDADLEISQKYFKPAIEKIKEGYTFLAFSLDTLLLGEICRKGLTSIRRELSNKKIILEDGKK